MKKQLNFKQSKVENSLDYETKAYLFQFALLFLLVPAWICRLLAFIGIRSMDVPSTILTILFLLLGALILPPLNLISAALVGALGFIGMYMLVFGITIFSATALVGGAIVLLSTCVVVVVVGGTIVGIFLVPMVGITPFLMPVVVGFMFTGMTFAAAIEAAMGFSAVLKVKLPILLRIPMSILVCLVVCWPLMTFVAGITGGFSCKPALAAQQNLINRTSHFFRGSDQTYTYNYDNLLQMNFFQSGFYDEVLMDGNNNIQQTGSVPADDHGEKFAFVMDNLLYVTYGEELSTSAIGYRKKKDDVLIATEDHIFIFSKNRVNAYLGGDIISRRLPWTKELKKMSQDDQYEHLYDILVRQSTTEDERFSLSEVAQVAYALHSGQLLEYNSETCTAYFAECNKGKTTVWIQDKAGDRRQGGTFEIDYKGSGLGYTALHNSGYLCFINGEKLQTMNMETGDTYTIYTNEDGHRLKSLNHIFNEEGGSYICCIDEKDQLFLESFNKNLSRKEPMDTKISAAQLVWGDYFYSIQYDMKNPVKRFSYALDYKPGDNIWEMFTPTWDYMRGLIVDDSF